MRSIQREAVYQRGEEAFRVIEMNEENTYYINFNKNKAETVKAIETSVLIEELEEGILQKVPDTYSKLIDFSELTEKQKEKAERYYQVFDQFWNNEHYRDHFLRREKHQEIFEILSEELKITQTSVRRLLARYFRGGMTKASVVPEYKKRGGYQQSGGKKGRKKKNGLEGIPITRKERELFSKYYEKEHLKNKKSLQSTYHILIKDCYSRSVRLADGTEKRILLPEEERPTFDQFYYWTCKREKAADKKEFLGDREYNNNFRVDRGSTLERVNGPGSRFEVDATHLNITVVSEFDRSQPLGRPLLYSVIDVFSKMVTGFCLTLKNESWETTALTIINTVRDKVEFCKAYGVEIDQEDWPSACLPRTFLLDNGPGKSLNIHNIANSYGVEFEFTPPYSPRLKPNIEHKHSDYKRIIGEFLPGADAKNEGERGTKDNRAEAVFTLSELTKILIQMTLYYNFQPIKGYQLTQEMLQDGIEATPVQLWHWGVKHGLGRQKEVEDLDGLRFSLLPRVIRTVSRKGIRFNKNDYIASDESGYQFLNNNIGKRVEVAYDKNDLNQIFMVEGEKYHQLRIKNPLSETEVISQYDLETLEEREFIHPDKYSREDLIESIEEETKEAVKQSGDPRQKKRNLKRLREKRREEIKRTEKRNSPVEKTDEIVGSKGERKISRYDLERRKFIAEKEAEIEREMRDE